MRQYWRPLVLRARAEGFVELGERWSLDGATAYVERNWGNGFPPVWWWGEAHDFGGDPVTVAFAGGPAIGPLHATAVVVHLAVPAHPPRRAAASRASAPRSRRAAGCCAAARCATASRSRRPATRPPPTCSTSRCPAERRVVPWSHQHLAGRLRVRVERRGRLVYEGESALAGLELGRAP